MLDASGGTGENVPMTSWWSRLREEKMGDERRRLSSLGHGYDFASEYSDDGDPFDAQYEYADLEAREERLDAGTGNDIGDAPYMLMEQLLERVPSRRAVWLATLYEVHLFQIEQSRPPRMERDSVELDCYAGSLEEARKLFEGLAARLVAGETVPEPPDWWDEEDPFHLHPMSPIREKHVVTMVKRKVAFQVSQAKRRGHTLSGSELAIIEEAARVEVEEEERARQVRGVDWLGGIPGLSTVRSMLEEHRRPRGKNATPRSPSPPRARPPGKPTKSKRRSDRDAARDRVLAVLRSHPDGASVGDVCREAAAQGTNALTHAVAKKLLADLIRRGDARLDDSKFRRELYFSATDVQSAPT